MVQNDLLDDQEEILENDELETVEEERVSKKEYDALAEKLDKIQVQLTESTKEGQLLGWKDRITKDKFEFIKLYGADRKMAEKIAKDFGDDRSLDKIVRDLKAEKNGDETTPNNRDDVEEMLNEREAKATLKSIQKEYKLDQKANSKTKDAIMEEYEDLMEGKKVTPENVDKYFRKAVRIVKKLDQHEEGISMIEKELQGAGAIGSIKGTSASKGDYFSQFEKGDHTTRYK